MCRLHFISEAKLLIENHNYVLIVSLPLCVEGAESWGCDTPPGRPLPQAQLRFRASRGETSLCLHVLDVCPAGTGAGRARPPSGGLGFRSVQGWHLWTVLCLSQGCDQTMLAQGLWVNYL